MRASNAELRVQASMLQAKVDGNAKALDELEELRAKQKKVDALGERCLNVTDAENVENNTAAA